MELFRRAGLLNGTTDDVINSDEYPNEPRLRDLPVRLDGIYCDFRCWGLIRLYQMLAITCCGAQYLPLLSKLFSLCLSGDL